jgi:hypothetical protein
MGTGVDNINNSTTASDDNLAPTRVLIPDTPLPVEDSEIMENIRTTKPRTRSRGKSNGVAAFIAPHAEASKIVNYTLLEQGNNTLTTYHKNACAAFEAFAKDRQVEIEFIGQFIKGIREPKTRNMLVDELQQAHPCRTDKDGKVEILCEWMDVIEGLKKAGIVTVEAGEGATQSPGAGRKKKKILIPKELIESGMMR